MKPTTPDPRPGSFYIRSGLLVLLVLFCSSCKPLSKVEQASVQDSLTLRPGESVGQTFVARYRGLAGFEVSLNAPAKSLEHLELRLRKHPVDSPVLLTSRLGSTGPEQAGYYRFSFSPLPNSVEREYYAELVYIADTEPEDEAIQVDFGPGNAYLAGALYQNGEPGEAQLAFRLLYDPVQVLIGLLGLVLRWGLFLIVAGFLFCLPGWALLCGTWTGWAALPWAARLGLSLGLSLALYPLLYLWTDLLGLRLGAAYAWLPPLASLLYLSWQMTRKGRLKSTLAKRFSLPSLFHAPLLSSYLFILSAGITFAVRFWVIHSLDAPMWGDGYHHALIAQLLVDQGGLFDSWLPYADLHSLTYHYGFHTLVACFHWITNLDVPQATLWVGQIVNGIAILSLYPMAMRIGRSPWAGSAAVLLGGLLFPMPMAYLNWSRFTQLAGQAILPVALFLIWEILEHDHPGWRPIGLAWLTLAGLALTHYRVLVFALLFLLAFSCLTVNRHNWRRFSLSLLKIGAGAGLICLTWFLHLYGGKIMRVFIGQISTPAGQPSAFSGSYNAVGALTTFLPSWAWLLLPLITAWGLWRREKGVAILGLWAILVVLSANPGWLNLPGTGAINNFTVLIAAYLPASILGGTALAWIVRESPQPRPEGKAHFRRVAEIDKLLLAAGLAGLALVGARQRIADPQFANHALVARPDLRAMAWIQANTSPQAQFLVNAFFAYNNRLVVGSDAGWWLPLLARRPSSLPPILYSSETGPSADYREWVNAIYAEILAKGITSAEVITMLRTRQITHIYIGQQHGRVNYTGPVIEPEQLLASPAFEPVYHQDRVWIFQVNP